VKIHHLDCISMCPLGGRLMDGRRELRGEPARLTCHCLLVEGDRGLVLVDTGFGLEDVRAPEPRLSPVFLALNRPQLAERDTAARQIERLGYRVEEVRHVVLTHLDFDHAGGLDDFPQAKVHLLAAEREVAFRQRTALDRQRFRPRQWRSAGRWITYPSGGGEPWFGFDCVRELEGLPPEILIVPLPGHTMGHAGVAIREGSRWLLHAGDAYFHRGEMNVRRPHCTPGLRAYQVMMEQDRTRRLANQRRLRELVARHAPHEVRVFCAHDAVEFEFLAAEADARRAAAGDGGRVLPLRGDGSGRSPLPPP
jgi:glyoxylase-like metal-dependent hydrolase (beta-lactamase superfamily II)